MTPSPHLDYLGMPSYVFESNDQKGTTQTYRTGWGGETWREASEWGREARFDGEEDGHEGE